MIISEIECSSYSFLNISKISLQSKYKDDSCELVLKVLFKNPFYDPNCKMSSLTAKI